MKKTLSALISILLAIVLLAPTAYAAPPDVSIQVDGQEIAFAEQEPVIREGYTWAPQEPLFQALGLSAADFPEKYDTIPINGTSYVKVRYIVETIGYGIEWESESRTVLIEKKGSRGYIWKTENQGNTVYLLGSLHVADNSFYPLKPAIESAFAEADYLGVEVDITKANTPEAQQLILSLGTYQDGTTLKDHISPAVYEKLVKILVENNLPENAMDTFKPWVVESVLTTLQAAKIGYEGQSGIDLYFLNKAKEQKIPIIELESLEFQMNMFNDFPDELQEKTLSVMLDEFYNTEAMDHMGKIWKEGDDAALQALIDEFKNIDDLYYNEMILDRNIGMAEKIEGYLNDPAQKVYFIVVGAAHMIGEDGILPLLEAKGYKVERL